MSFVLQRYDDVHPPVQSAEVSDQCPESSGAGCHGDTSMGGAWAAERENKGTETGVLFSDSDRHSGRGKGEGFFTC